MRIRVFISTILLCATVLAHADEEKLKAYYQNVDSADYYIAQKDYISAEKFIVNALRADPANYNNSLLLSNLATLQRMQKRYDEAINNYTLALTLAPNAVTMLTNRGKLYFEIDSLSKAEWDFNKIIELEPRNLTARYYLTLVQIAKNDLEAAKESIDDMQLLSAKDVMVSDVRAQWHQAHKDYSDAIQLYTKLIKIEKRYEWLVNRAECYIERKAYSPALADIADAMELYPEDSYLYLLKAKIKKRQYENDAAQKLIEQAVKLGADEKAAKKFVG